MNVGKYIFPCLVALTMPGSLIAEQKASQPTVQIHGRAEVTVNNKEVRLSDIAEIVVEDMKHSEAAVALGKITLAKSPRPKEILTLSASEVLSLLRKAGVDFTQVGYALPRMIAVKRASREVSDEDIRQSVEKHFQALPGAEVLVKRILNEEPVHVTPDNYELEVSSVRHQSRGRVRVAMVARVADEAPLSFNVSADIDEFREVPVAARPVERGMRIADSDVMYARMNIAQLPVDALRDEEEIVGQEVKGSLGYGDIFRRRSLHIPPVIKAGSPVSIQFSSPLLVATASGTAIEAGAQDELIRVRNEASKRVFQARVLAPGLVEVNE